MDRGIVAKLAEIGFLGCALPEEHGGMGLDTVSYCLVMEELGRADSSVRGIVSVNNGLAGKTIAKWGTEEQKAEWLPKLCSGEARGLTGVHAVERRREQHQQRHRPIQPHVDSPRGGRALP